MSLITLKIDGLLHEKFLFEKVELFHQDRL